MYRFLSLAVVALLTTQAFSQGTGQLSGYAVEGFKIFKLDDRHDDSLYGRDMVFSNPSDPQGTMVDVEYSLADNKLYMLTTGNRIYSIDPRPRQEDPNTVLATNIGTTPFANPASFTPSAFAIDPVSNEIRVVDLLGQNLRVSPATGALIGTDTPLTYAPGDPNAGSVPQITKLAYTPGPSATLYGHDSVKNVTVRIGNSGDSSSANLGVVTTIGGFSVPAYSNSPAWVQRSTAWADIAPNGQAYGMSEDAFEILFNYARFLPLELTNGDVTEPDHATFALSSATYSRFALVDDADDDMVLGTNDVCPASPFGLAVDATGCPLTGFDLVGNWATPKVKCNTKKGFCTASSTFYVLPSESGDQISFNVNVYQSRFPALDKPATLLFTKQVKIKKGKPAKVKVKASNIAITAAPIYLIADIDVTDQVTEVNEINNESSLPVL